eukprot:3489196-Rhodomonas_salina.1
MSPGRMRQELASQCWSCGFMSTILCHDVPYRLAMPVWSNPSYGRAFWLRMAVYSMHALKRTWEHCATHWCEPEAAALIRPLKPSEPEKNVFGTSLILSNSEFVPTLGAGARDQVGPGPWRCEAAPSPPARVRVSESLSRAWALRAASASSVADSRSQSLTRSRLYHAGRLGKRTALRTMTLKWCY